MAYIVEPPDAHTSRARTVRRYPWAQWSDGQWRQAVRGEDYKITDGGFRACLYRYAQAAGRTAESRKNDLGVVFRIGERA